MPERRNATRQKSFLQGRIYYNNRRASVDCLVRDVSEHGAKVVFGGAVTIPDVVELFVSNKTEPLRARVQWRRGKDMGVTFGEDVVQDQLAASSDLVGRLLRLEGEHAALKRTVSDLRAEMRKLRGEPD